MSEEFNATTMSFWSKFYATQQHLKVISYGPSIICNELQIYCLLYRIYIAHMCKLIFF